MYNSAGFFFLVWAAHYVPFFIMGRQLFLHHYLPAHLASALVAGALLEFIFNLEPLNGDMSDVVSSNASAVLTTEKKKALNAPGVAARRPVRESIGSRSLLASWIAATLILGVVVWSFFFFAPLTYGNLALDVDQVNARKWLAYDLHFAK